MALAFTIKASAWIGGVGGLAPGLGEESSFFDELPHATSTRAKENTTICLIMMAKNKF